MDERDKCVSPAHLSSSHSNCAASLHGPWAEGTRRGGIKGVMGEERRKALEDRVGDRAGSVTVPGEGGQLHSGKRSRT